MKLYERCFTEYQHLTRKFCRDTNDRTQYAIAYYTIPEIQMYHKVLNSMEFNQSLLILIGKFLQGLSAGLLAVSITM